ncbi:uncharacterized protein LOC120111746 [Phoenix dactylifera]|uniref:Uncharacterized protein LOC120111746 n=1 Tax=Phoenix dactylifera TaxID=42345 RepID=A0A8B9AFR3_PHODC|nr:uncharacterized protein LOC120111746 [Phoenix dactylifera]
MSLSPLCLVCGVAESVDHVLFHCERARGVWRLTEIQGDAWSSRVIFLEIVRHWAGDPHMRRSAIRASCTAYQIWLARNARVFGERRLSQRFVMERACAQADEIIHVESAHRPLIARDTWGSHIASAAPHRVFFTWEPPPPSFLKVNFDGSVLDGGRRGGAGFIVRGPGADAMAAGGCQIFDTSVPGAELHAAWMGLSYARRVLHASSILLEGDSATVVSWIRRGPSCHGGAHPLLRDIWMMAREEVTLQAMHVYREANGVADWVASYVACHSGGTLWAGERDMPGALRDLLYSDSIGCIRTRYV